MNIKICGINVHYETYGRDAGRDVVLLHGWGCNIQSFMPVIQSLKADFKVTALDLPGFGESDELQQPWSAEQYADAVIKFLDVLEIKNPILIGHSHGGRTIIYMTGKLKYKAHKIILIDSAGVKPKRSLKYYYKVYTFKLFKHIAKLTLPKEKSEKLIESARSKRGSTDYKQASPVLRATLVKLVNTDLRFCMPDIKAPTLLIWGENDTATPLSDGQIMEKLIPDAGICVLKGAGHFSYLDRAWEFDRILHEFLRKDKEA